MPVLVSKEKLSGTFAGQRTIGLFYIRIFKDSGLNTPYGHLPTFSEISLKLLKNCHFFSVMNHRLRTILSQGIEILAICGLTMTAIAQDNLPSPSSPLMDQDTFEHLMNTAPHKLLIVGRWRGFHQIEEKSFYYLYEFRADGTYRARHRLYEKNEQEFTETFWQGTWDFKDQFVEIEGNEVNEPEKRVKLQFKLAEDNFLYATPQENESLSLILPRKMGKQ